MKKLKYQIWSKLEASGIYYLFKEYDNPREAANTISYLTFGAENNCTYKVKIIEL